MALTGLDFILAAGKDLVPHIEHAAIKFMLQQYTMAQRVNVLQDMRGWNERKISAYLPPRRAASLSENTDIPTTELHRARLAAISPKEVGDAYLVSDRRVDTDPESIVTDIVTALGAANGSAVEVDLLQEGLSTFRGGTFGGSATAWSIALAVQAGAVAKSRFGRGELYHVGHMYQVLPLIENMVTVTGAESGAAAMQNANQGNVVSEFNFPLIGNFAAAPLFPRKVVLKLIVDGDGGTFRLQVGSGYTIGENITGAITVSAVAATMVANVQAALDALDMSGYYAGSDLFVVSGAAIDDITITPPADFYLDDPSQMRVAVKYDTDVTADGGSFDVIVKKSAYDLVTNPSGVYVDTDGTSLGVVILERSATAKQLSFFRPALVYDIRKPLKAGFNDLYADGRSAKFYAYQTYGVGFWRPNMGFLIETTADSPLAVGA